MRTEYQILFEDGSVDTHNKLKDANLVFEQFKDAIELRKRVWKMERDRTGRTEPIMDFEDTTLKERGELI